MKRKSIGKRVRFEIFKRDSFKCKYCGKSPPEVVLHIDHILPVSKGGSSDMINLATSCQDCNLGKSNVLISDTAMLDRQAGQIRIEKEKMDQIKMVIKWRRSIKNGANKEIMTAKKEIEDLIGRYFSPSGSYIEKLKKTIKKYSLKSVLEAIDICSEKYLKDKTNRDCVGEFLEKIIKISSYIEDQKINPWKKEAGYCYAILNNRFGKGRDGEYWSVLKKAFTHKDFTFNEMKDVCSNSKYFYDVKLYVENYLEKVQ